MDEAFNPYRKWLGIPENSLPPTHYQLLSVDTAERDPEVINAAVVRQSAYVRNFQSGKYAEHANRILTEIAIAKACLLDQGKRATYDEELARRQGEQNARPVAAAAAPARSPAPRSPARRSPGPTRPAGQVRPPAELFDSILDELPLAPADDSPLAGAASGMPPWLKASIGTAAAVVTLFLAWIIFNLVRSTGNNADSPTAVASNQPRVGVPPGVPASIPTSSDRSKAAAKSPPGAPGGGDSPPVAGTAGGMAAAISNRPTPAPVAPGGNSPSKAEETSSKPTPAAKTDSKKGAKWSNGSEDSNISIPIAFSGEEIVFAPYHSPYVAIGKNVWDLQSGDNIGTVSLPLAHWGLNALSPGGTMFATASEESSDNTIEVCNTTTGAADISLEYEGGSGSLKYVGFASDEVLVAIWSAGFKSYVHVWDVAKRKLKREFPCVDCQLGTVAITHDGAYLAGAISEGVVVYKLDTGKVAARLVPKKGEGSIRPEGVAFSPDGQHCAVVLEKGKRLLCWSGAGKLEVDMDTGIDVDVFYEGEHVQWLADGSGLLLNGRNIVDFETRRPVWSESSEKTVPRMQHHLFGKDKFAVMRGTVFDLHLTVMQVPTMEE